MPIAIACQADMSSCSPLCEQANIDAMVDCQNCVMNHNQEADSGMETDPDEARALFSTIAEACTAAASPVTIKGLSVFLVTPRHVR